MQGRISVATAAAICLTLALCSNASASSRCAGDEKVPTASTIPQAAVALVCDINVLRTDHGLKPLSWDWQLWLAAQRMANDMSARHYVAHTTPDGVTLSERVVKSGYGAGDDWMAVENLGWADGVYSSPLAFALGWMKSEEHRQNMLSPEVENVGVGMTVGAVRADGTQGMFYVVDFGRHSAPQPARASACARGAHSARSTRKHRVRTRAKRVRPRTVCRH